MKHLRWLLFLFCVPAHGQFVPHAPAKAAYCLNPSSVWIPVNASELTGSTLSNSPPAGDLYALNANGNWYGIACDASGNLISGGDAPGGSNGQLQRNNEGVLDGTPGGTTNGTHFAFGAGSTVDGAAFIDPGGSTTPPAAVQNIYESVTDPALENGVFTLLDVTPSATPTNWEYVNFAVGQLHGNNWGGAQGSAAASGQLTYDGTGTGASAMTTMVGVFGEADNLEGGEVQGEYGGTLFAANLGAGEVDTAIGDFGSVNNNGTGLIDLAEGVQGSLATGGNGSTTTMAVDFYAHAPFSQSADTIGAMYGLYLDEMCGDGVTACDGMYQPNDDPNLIGGPTTFGDIVAPGILTLAQGTTNIATATGEGWQFNCSDCDTPLTEGATCTAAGDHAGTLAIALRGAIKCF